MKQSIQRAVVIGLCLGAVGAGAMWMHRRREKALLSGPAETALASRLDKLLNTPLSAAERAEIATGPQVILDDDVPAADVAAVRRGIEALFRVAMAIEFDEPIPVVGVRRMWDFIKANVRTFRVLKRTPVSQSWEAVYQGGERIVRVPHDSVMIAGRPMWSDPNNGGAGLRQIVVLIHEAQHLAAPEKMHNCSSNGVVCMSDLDMRRGTCPPGFNDGAHIYDSSLEYGGAWAAHYWTMKWLASHSGDWLLATDRAWMDSEAEPLRNNVFCDRNSAGRGIHFVSRT